MSVLLLWQEMKLFSKHDRREGGGAHCVRAPRACACAHVKMHRYVAQARLVLVKRKFPNAITDVHHNTLYHTSTGSIQQHASVSPLTDDDEARTHLDLKGA